MSKVKVVVSIAITVVLFIYVSCTTTEDDPLKPGGKMVTVPDIIGTDQESAESSIINADLTIGGITEENSATVADSYVIGQEILPPERRYYRARPFT